MNRKQTGAGLLALVLALWTGCGLGASAPNVAEAKKSVVRVYTEYYYGDILVTTSTGSGFAVGDDPKAVSYFVTNRHVVENTWYEVEAGNYIELEARYFYIITNDFQTRIPASRIHMSDRTDLAILQVHTPISDRKPAILRPFTSLGNEVVVAIGFPGMADKVLSVDEQKQIFSSYEDMSVSQGIVSRVTNASQLVQGEVIQTDADINGGNSGGPLVDANQQVLGVNTASIIGNQNQDIVQGMHYAVSSNQVIRMLNEEGIPYLVPQAGLNPWLIAGLVLLAACGVAAVLIIRQVQHPQKGKETPKKSTAARMLVGTAGVLEGKTYPLGRKTVIGRDAKRCQIRFPEGTGGVSGVHCTLRFDGIRVTVTDERSTYGTFIDTTKLEAGKPTRMHRGQTLSIGSAKNGFKLK